MDLNVALGILAVIYALVLVCLTIFIYLIHNNVRRIIVLLEQRASEKHGEREVVGSNIKICVHCGATNRWMDSFCVKCGEPV